MTLFGSTAIAVMIVLDVVLFPLETDYEPWYYFFLIGCFVLVTVAGLALSFRRRNIFTVSKKEYIFSSVLLTVGFLLVILLFAEEKIFLRAGAAGFGLMIVGGASLLSTLIGLNYRRSLPSNGILQAFPEDVRPSAEAVEKRLKGSMRKGYIVGGSYYRDFDRVLIPISVHMPDMEYRNTADSNAKTIYECLQTRNWDGRIRERYIKMILSGDRPRWVIPFIIEASTDRVVEVVNAIYEGISDKLKEEIAYYYKNNLEKFRHDYSKTISYWNAYHRADYPDYRDYPGYKLFTACYGFQKRYYKEACRISAETKKWNQLWAFYAEGTLEKIPFLLCGYYSGVMGEGHACFLSNADSRECDILLSDYVEKLRGILGPGLYDNLMNAVNAYGTKKEAQVCSLADAYFYEHEEEMVELLKKYADDLRL